MGIEKYRIVYEGNIGEYVEKKSRFIAEIRPIICEAEAVDFINAKKKEYWDARHNCSAFVLGEHNEITRCNDDGEPAQTAGRPMLDVLLNENLHNCVVVVTRYFGGVLLGTGGLVRAYQKAVQNAIANSAILELEHGHKLQISTDYNGYGKLEYLLREQNLPILNVEYGADVKISSVVPIDMKEQIEKAVADKTAGAAQLEWEQAILYGLYDGKLIEI